MQAISVHVDKIHYEQFKNLAGSQGVPVAELIRRAMAQFLEQHSSAGRSWLDFQALDAGAQYEDGRAQLGSYDRSATFDEMLGSATSN